MGPMGQGPMTGRAAGYCAGYAVPGFMNPVSARGFWGGRGWGGGGGGRGGWRHRHWYYATGLPGWQRSWTGWSGPGAWVPGSFPPPLSEEQELLALQQQATNLEQVLGELKTRIQELERPEAAATPSTGKEGR